MDGVGSKEPDQIGQLPWEEIENDVLFQICEMITII